jgi:FKBP-type peptidyl-prolyl cis-trans isomerase
MRTLPFAAALAVPALILSLAACAPADEPETPDTAGTDTPVACAPSGPYSEAVEVSGDFDTVPTVEFPAPLTPNATQRTVITEGDGTEIQDGAQVQVHFAMFNGETGEAASSTGYDEAQLFTLTVDEAQYLPGLVKTVRCGTIGSRIVGVIPASDAFGDAGNTDVGIGPGEPLVFVIDLVSVVEPLVPAEWETDVPEVSLEGDAPVVTLPASGPPSELVMAVLEEGDGEVVTGADSPSLDYQGTSWQTGEVFDQSYGSSPIALPATGYVKGFSAAIIGQKAGSTVIVSIPPELAYGTDPAAHALGGQTLLFVIQIRSV